MSRASGSLARLVSLAPCVLALAMPQAAGADPLAGRTIDERERASPRTIQVSGEATITSRPDRAEVDLGVVTQAPSSERAAQANAEKVTAVVATLERALGPRARIETTSYTLHPVYRDEPDRGTGPRGAPVIAGYRASNVVRVTLDELAEVGRAIDAATRAGANQVQRLRFTLRDSSSAQERALRAAALAARAKAEALAHTLDLGIVRVHSVVETGAPVRPMYEMALARAETPIAPGEIDTTAAVTLTVEIVATGRPRADPEVGSPAPRRAPAPAR